VGFDRRVWHGHDRMTSNLARHAVVAVPHAGPPPAAVGRLYLPVFSVSSMMAVVVKLPPIMRVDACGPRVLCAVQGVARSLRHTDSVHTPFPRPSRGSGLSRGCDDPALAFYPGSQQTARPPETVLLGPDTRAGTLSVAVVSHDPSQTVRRTRETRHPTTTRLSKWRRRARCPRLRTATRQSPIGARRRQSRCVAGDHSRGHSAPDTTA